MSLKRFLYKCLIFIAVALPIITGQSLYAYFTKSYESSVYGNEIYLSINKSKVKKKVKTLIIGDSVGKQLYDNETYNGDVYSETSNQAISMAGYYFLIKNFFDVNTGQLPGTVVLILTPETFTNNLDQKFTFHYFLKPFYKEEYKQYFSPACLYQVRKVPFYYLSQCPFIVNTNWSPDYTGDNKHNFKFISQISNDYLIKIKQLCSHYNVKFLMYCPPVRMAGHLETINFSRQIAEIEKTGLEKEFTTYFKNAIFLPDSLYQDHIHFKKEYIPKDYFKIGINN
jgi:hypothetical protein